MKFTQRALIGTILLVLVSAASNTWQNIQIQMDYSNLSVDSKYLNLLQSEIDLAILYIESLIQVPTQQYNYQFPEGLQCNNIQIDLNTSTVNLILIVVMSDDIEEFVRGYSCIYNNNDIPIVATLQMNSNYPLVDFNFETQLIISEISRILSFEPQYIVTLPSSKGVQFVSSRGVPYLQGQNLQQQLATFLGCPNVVGLQLSSMGYKGDPSSSIQDRIYIDSLILGNVMWSQNQQSFRQITFTDIHQTIFEQFGQYKFTRDLDSGNVGGLQGCGVRNLSSNCDETRQFKTLCDRSQNNSCVSTDQILACNDPSSYYDYPAYIASGEQFGPKSFCMESDIWNDLVINVNPPKINARCLKVLCYADSYAILIEEEQPQNCTKGLLELTTFVNYNGTVSCAPFSVVCGVNPQFFCDNDCNEHGVCMEGVCFCEEAYHGSFCQHTIITQADNSTYVTQRDCALNDGEAQWECDSTCLNCDKTSNYCTTKTHMCTKCQDGYFVDNDNMICAACLPQCLTCFYREVCATCRNNLAGSLCSCAVPQKWTDLVSFNCTDTLNTTCLNAFQTDQKSFICLPCDYQHCSKCLSQTLDDTYLSICQQCNDGYYWDLYQYQCLQCSFKCDTCSQTKDNCTKCALTYTAVPDCGACQNGLNVLANGDCDCGATQRWNSTSSSCVCPSPAQQKIQSHVVARKHTYSFGVAGYLKLSNDPLYCVQCPPSCQECEMDGNQIVCLVCSGGFYLQLIEGRCKICPIGCVWCMQYTAFQYPQCTVCEDSFVEKKGACVCERSSVVAIINNQYFCSQPSTQVNLCPLEYAVYEGMCQYCGEGCQQCRPDLSCSKCEVGYYAVGRDCKGTQYCIDRVACASECRSCSSLSQCDSCHDTLGVVSQGCTCPLSLYREVEYQCVSVGAYACNDFYYTQNQTCLACSTHCRTCNNNTTCSVCIDGFYLQDDLQCVECMPTCKTCTDSASCSQCINSDLTTQECSCYADQLIGLDYTCQNEIECPNGYAVYDANPTFKSCVSCSDNCYECTAVQRYSSECTLCQDGFVLDGLHCQDCLIGCQQYALCVNDGYYFSEVINACIRCPGCQPGQCQYARTLDANGVQEIYQECSQCLHGYHQSAKGECSQCSARCKECELGHKICTQCAPNRQSAPMCQCAANLFEDPATLECVALDNQACPAGSVMFQDVDKSSMCVVCPLHCQNCKAVSFDVATCVQCDPSYVWNAVTNRCQPCKVGCATCPIERGVSVCRACEPGFAGTHCGCVEDKYLESGVCVVACSARSASFITSVGLRTCLECADRCIKCQAFEQSDDEGPSKLIVECLQCQEGYYYGGITCEPCNPRCATCLSRDKCQTCSLINKSTTNNSTTTNCTCSNLYDISNNECVDVCSPNQTKQGEVCADSIWGCVFISFALDSLSLPLLRSQHCALCGVGFYLNGGLCYECQSNCISCSQSLCLYCKVGTHLVGGVCACPAHYTQDYETGQCIHNEMCPPQFQLIAVAVPSGQSMVCAQCPKGCDGCEIISHSDVDDGVGYSSLICSSCVDGYYFNHGNYKCQRCPSRCATCLSASKCVTCDTLPYPMTTQCECQLGWHLDGATQQCTLQGNETSCAYPHQVFYQPADQGSMCLSCQYGCLECHVESTQLMCSSCDNTKDFYLAGSRCLNCLSEYDESICQPEGYLCMKSNDLYFNCQRCNSQCKECANSPTIYLETYCTSCPDGSYLNQGECLRCPLQCLQCNNAQACIVCRVGTLPDCSCGAGLTLRSTGTCFDVGRMKIGDQICNAGYGVSSYQSTVVCKLCESDCEDCSYIDSKQYCYECGVGYYLKQYECLKCGPLCLTCTDSLQCTKCNVVASQTPLCQCAEHTLYYPLLEVCVATCLIEEGQYVVGGVCHDCAHGCQLCRQDHCVTCMDGYYLNGVTCRECSSTCTRCQGDSNNCTQCSDAHGFPPLCGCRPGQFDMDVFCLDIQDLEQKNVNLCPMPFQVLRDNNHVLQCNVCFEGCEECAYFGNHTSCTLCGSGYYLSQTTVIVDHTYLLTLNQCYRCSNQCQTCLNGADDCRSCAPHRSGLPHCACQVGWIEDAQSKACVPAISQEAPCPTNQYLFDGVCFVLRPGCHNQACTRCLDGYFTNQGECLPCPHRCLTCTNDLQCTTCRSDRLTAHPPACQCAPNSHQDIFQDNVCITMEGSNATNADLCPLIHMGFVMDEVARVSQCIICDPNCIQCSPSGQCKECEWGLILYDNQCIQCPSNCRQCAIDLNDNKSVCEECEPGFYIDVLSQCNNRCAPQCQTCSVYYDQCDSATPHSSESANQSEESISQGSEGSQGETPPKVIVKHIVNKVDYANFHESLAFGLLILILILYIAQMMMGHWFDGEQKDNFILDDITEVELRGRSVNIYTWIMGILVLRNPFITISFYHSTSPRPLRSMFSLSKMLIILVISAFLSEFSALNNITGTLLVDLIVVVPVAAILQLLRNYTARSKRLASVGYFSIGLTILICIVMIVIQGIQSEPHAQSMEQWGKMAIRIYLWEIVLIDSLRGLFYLLIYRQIVENGESSFESIVDQRELKQFYKKYTQPNYTETTSKVVGFKVEPIQDQNKIHPQEFQSVISQPTVNEQGRLPWEHGNSDQELNEDKNDNPKTKFNIQNKDL